MDLQQKIDSFQNLRQAIHSLIKEDSPSLFIQAKNQNNWFTLNSCKNAFEGIAKMLDPVELEAWVSKYDIQKSGDVKDIGLLLAGNIPAVGFHDLLCVLLSGHKASLKLSASDSVLISWVLDRLIQTDESFKDFIQVEPMLKKKDAYIATGSDNSSRYFDYYFGKYPHIIRKNRTSIAVLTGEESEQDILNLGKDIFTYFGLGCRNVSKVFVKNKEVLQRLLGILEAYIHVADHHKYFNNYEYNKSIYLVNKTAHLDNGFLLLKEENQLVSPIGVLFYEVYKDEDELAKVLVNQKEKIQCVVGSSEEFTPFGESQYPKINDYADGVDTMRFLTQL